MPENVNETTNEAGSGTNPSQQPPSEPRTGVESTGFRYTDGPFKGLTAAEAAAKYDNDVGQYSEQYNQLASQVQNYVQSLNQQQRQQQSIPNVSDQDLSDLWLTDPARAQAMLTQSIMGQVQQYGNQAFQPVYQGQASLARANSQNDLRLKDIWDKYGREIDNLMSKVPPQNKISKDVWDQAAKLIKSNHVDDIVNERAQEMLARLPQTETGQSTRASLPETQSSAIEKIRSSDYGKNHLDYLSDAQLIEQAKKMGNTIEEYAAMVESTRVVANPKKPGEWRNEGLVRDYQPQS